MKRWPILHLIKHWFNKPNQVNLNLYLHLSLLTRYLLQYRCLSNPLNNSNHLASLQTNNKWFSRCNYNRWLNNQLWVHFNHHPIFNTEQKHLQIYKWSKHLRSWSKDFLLNKCKHLSSCLICYSINEIYLFI